jgi:hypothetical protein
MKSIYVQQVEGGCWGAMTDEKSGKPGSSFKKIRKYSMAFLKI